MSNKTNSGMEITLSGVINVIDREIKDSNSSTSAYVYIPKKYAGKKAKICIME